MKSFNSFMFIRLFFLKKIKCFPFSYMCRIKVTPLMKVMKLTIYQSYVHIGQLYKKAEATESIS